jgi:hypothetical protein
LLEIFLQVSNVPRNINRRPEDENASLLGLTLRHAF